uniref:Uncharacterized protein n=1 Tax=Octopus bimaculoides TaxID=37653 RepID=A0A0L8HTG1_OCTBM
MAALCHSAINSWSLERVIFSPPHYNHHHHHHNNEMRQLGVDDQSLAHRDIQTLFFFLCWR